jgi:hypothetical protein
MALGAVTVTAALFGTSGPASAAGGGPFVTATSETGSGTVGAGKTFHATYSSTPVLAGSYGITLTDGIGVGTLSTADGNLSAVVSGNGVIFTALGPPLMSAGASLSLSRPLEVLSSTGVTDASGDPWNLPASGQIDNFAVLLSGDDLAVTFDEAVTVGAYSVQVQEGASSATIDASNSTASGTGTATITFHLTSNLSSVVGADGPGVPSFTGITGIATPHVTTVAATLVPSSECGDVSGFTRVFASGSSGSNCSIMASGGPTAPGVFDVIPLPTTDLVGPPDDNAPEVITNCAAGSTDTVFDVNTGAQLGTNPCGNNPPEQLIGNTNSSTLDYIPTPTLASFEEAGVLETIAGTNYVSPTTVPPQLKAIAVSGSSAMFTYYDPVVCQNTSSDGPTWSQFSYVSPVGDLAPGDRVYPNSIACPSGSGGLSITVGYGGPIPFNAGVRFKFEGFGPGHFIVGAPGSSFAFEREASESAYAGPDASISAFTPASTTTTSSTGGSVPISFATANAQTCTLSASASPSTAAALSLPSAASCNGSGNVVVPANASTSAVAYTVTLTAAGPRGTLPAQANVTINVPATGTVSSAASVPTISSLPVIHGAATEGATLTESHGLWSGSPSGYSYRWERCDTHGDSCTTIADAAAESYTLKAADVGSTIRVGEIASNAAGPGAEAISANTATVTSAGATPHAPNTTLLKATISAKSKSATFRFRSSGQATGFQCALVLQPVGKHARKPRRRFVRCSSMKAYLHLKVGRTYSFYVRAIGPGGADGTPAATKFTLHKPKKAVLHRV